MIGELVKREIIATNTYEITFSVSNKLKFLPGQYTTITISNPKQEDYQMNQRIFSLVNSPTQNGMVKIVFRYRDSGFKNNLLQMRAGEKVWIDKPIGIFDLPKDDSIPLVFLATGVGIAPFISKLSFLREQRSRRNIWLFFSNYSSETAPYLNFLAETKKDLVNLTTFLIMTRDKNWPGEKERVTVKTVRKQLPGFARANFFLAGLPEFVDDLMKQLLEEGVPRGSLFQESFDGY